MSDAIRIRAKARDGWVEALILMPHPMETGLRKGPEGDVIAAHYITDVQVSVGERRVLSAQMSFAMSRDPLLSFRFCGAAAGERLSVQWTDNRGERRTDSALIT